VAKGRLRAANLPPPGHFVACRGEGAEFMRRGSAPMGADRPRSGQVGASECEPYFGFRAAWTSISTSMPAWTRAVIWLVMREGLLGCSAVPKKVL